MLHTSYIYYHGVNHIYHKTVMYGQSLTADKLSDSVYEVVEKKYSDIPSGTRVMVRKEKRNGIIKHYTTRKVDDGFVRQTIVFQEGELDPFPVTIDEVEYDENK
jgi:hypothetical protein